MSDTARAGRVVSRDSRDTNSSRASHEPLLDAEDDVRDPATSFSIRRILLLVVLSSCGAFVLGIVVGQQPAAALKSPPPLPLTAQTTLSPPPPPITAQTTLSPPPPPLTAQTSRSPPPPSPLRERVTCWLPPVHNLTLVSLLHFEPPLAFDYARCARCNRLRYAARHGLEYCEYHHSLDDTKPAPWSKLYAIAEVLRRPHTMVAAWLDADAFFLHERVSLAALAAHHEDKDLILTADSPITPDSSFNTGVLLARRTLYARRLLFNLRTRHNASEQHTGEFYEQAALAEHVHEDPARFEQHAVVLPFRDGLNHVGWRPGDYSFGARHAMIAHYAWGPNRSKYRVIFDHLRCGGGDGATTRRKRESPLIRQLCGGL